MDEDRPRASAFILNDPRGPGRSPRRDRRRRRTPRRARGGSGSRETRRQPQAYAPDTPEFLYWQLASALDRGKRSGRRIFRAPERWIPGRVLPAVPGRGKDLNAFYDRKALRFFRDVDREDRQRSSSRARAPTSSTHEQGHAILDAIRPDLWDAPHFEVAAFHEGFGDLAAIFVALAEPRARRRRRRRDAATIPSRSNLVSRLAEELGAAVRDAYGPDAALPDALRDAVNAFRYTDPQGLPDDAPATALSAEPHSFCRVMTGACWDVLVAIFRAAPGKDRAAALVDRRGEGRRALHRRRRRRPPSGADFFASVSAPHRPRGRVAMGRRARSGDRRRALSPRTAREPPGSPRTSRPTRTRRSPSRRPRAGPSPAVRAGRRRAARSRTGRLLVSRSARREPERPSALRVFRGRRRRDLVLRGREYGPADGARASRSRMPLRSASVRGGIPRRFARPPRRRSDADDARAFVRFLARRGRIAEAGRRRPDSVALARSGSRMPSSARTTACAGCGESGSPERKRHEFRVRETAARPRCRLLASGGRLRLVRDRPPPVRRAEPVTPADFVASIADVAAGRNPAIAEAGLVLKKHRVPPRGRHGDEGGRKDRGPAPRRRGLARRRDVRSSRSSRSRSRRRRRADAPPRAARARACASSSTRR